MSFGLLKHFKDIKKGYEEEVKPLFVKNVILGSDLGAVLKLMELRKTETPESIKLISNRIINKKSLIEQYHLSVSMLRSENAVTEIYKNHFNAKILPQKSEPIFYKDGKFHEFNSRAKPMEILSLESFFLTKGYRVDIGSFFSPEDWENLDQILNQHLDIRILEGVEKTTSQDLVDKAEWLLTFKDFKKISAEYLYSALSPKKFLNYLKNKDELTSDVIDFFSSIEVQSALSISWKLNKLPYEEDKTLFLPQSMTHEWGHFIVEFEENTEGKWAHGLFIVHDEEPQTEDLGAKIKLMKRVIERVFPQFETMITAEFIRFDDEMFMTGVKDELLEKLAFDYPTLKPIGQLAATKSQLGDEKYLSRILLS